MVAIPLPTVSPKPAPPGGPGVLRTALRWGYDRTWHWPPVLATRNLPMFRRFFGYWPNLFRPKTLNEKIHFRLLFDRRKVLQVFAGKYESRQYVADRGLAHLLVTPIALVRRGAEIRTLTLPRDFVVKANHGSTMTRIYHGWDGSGIAELEAEIDRMIGLQYGKYNGEWNYSGAERMVVIEPLISNAGDLPHDYKFWCCDGRTVFFNFSPEVLREGTRNLFDRDLNWLPIDFMSPRGAVEPVLSPRIREMMAVAEQLSAGVDFVRVDLLDTDDRFYFGELTACPLGGFIPFTPKSWDTTFGAAWTLPRWRELRGRG